MKIPRAQDQAIAARMALVVGADNFDRLFRGIQFDGTVLHAYAADEFRAAEIEDTLSLHISTIAAGILKREAPNNGVALNAAARMTERADLVGGSVGGYSLLMPILEEIAAEIFQ